MSSVAYKYEDNSSPSDQVELFEIAHQMKVAQIADDFIAAAIKTALDYAGVADLLKLWRDECDKKEKDEIVDEIKDLIDDC